MIDLNNAPIAAPERRWEWPSRAEIDRELRERVADLVESIRPDLKHNPAMSTRTVTRYGSKGGFKVDVGGSTMGRITAWSEGRDKGMSPLQFIGEELGLDQQGAFRWACQWLGYEVPTDSDIPAPKPRPKAPVAAQVGPTPAEVAEAARRRSDVDWIIRRTVPAVGTPAALYLASRGVTAAPDCIGWNATDGAMVCKATDESGVVHALQMIYLTPDGRKDPRTRNNGSAPNGIVKRTRKARDGWNTQAAMRCPVRPGLRDDVIVVAEGPEGGLTPWQLLAVAAGEPVEGTAVTTERAGTLFREYAAAFKGRRQLVYSPGLRSTLGLDAQVSDADLAADRKDEGGQILATIDGRTWSLIVSRGLRAWLLEIALNGAEALAVELDGLRAEAGLGAHASGRI